ncbi:MAG: HAD family hydrolase [Actinomycetota bacterium]
MTFGPFALVATDLDGALLGSDASVSAYAADVLLRVQAAGVPVVPVTGRPPRSVIPLVAQCGISGYAICGSGSLLFDLETETVIQRPRCWRSFAPNSESGRKK